MALVSTKGDDKNVAETHETPNGKVIEIFMPPHGCAAYEIHFKSGGQKPKEFDGVFMSRASARKAVKVYLSRLARDAEAKASKSPASSKKEAK